METKIRKTVPDDYEIISRIGRSGVAASHRDSCSAEDMDEFLKTYYNHDAIKKELTREENIYHIISYKDSPAGFSNMILNVAHPNIPLQNSTKLDRIYLLEEYYDKKMGLSLLQYNVELSKANNQSGMWLFTWQGNQRAVDFYKKAGFKIVGTHRFKVTETHYNPHFQMLLQY